jgi:hypothetical protein
MLGHVERITPSTHDSAIQIRLKFDGAKRVQVIASPISNQKAKNSIQLSRSPILARVWPHTQLVSQVLGDPLCQLDGKKLQKGVVPAVGILENLGVPLVAPSCSKYLLLQQHNVQGRGAVKVLAISSIK